MARRTPMQKPAVLAKRAFISGRLLKLVEKFRGNPPEFIHIARRTGQIRRKGRRRREAPCCTTS